MMIIMIKVRIRFKIFHDVFMLTSYPLHKGRNINGGSGTPVYTFPESTICRYWKAGYCRKAEECPYRHIFQNLTMASENQEFESETFPNRKPPVCSYWDAGDCARGEHCRFRHDPKV